MHFQFLIFLTNLGFQTKNFLCQFQHLQWQPEQAFLEASFVRQLNMAIQGCYVSGRKSYLPVLQGRHLTSYDIHP